MAAGRLRDRVKFQREREPDDVIEDGAGGYDLQWKHIGTVWGELVFANSREASEAGRLESATMGTLIVRSSDFTRGITAADRCLINDEPYNIRSNQNYDRRGVWRQMLVEVGVGT